MKKLGRTAILAVLIVILSALLFVACNTNDSDNNQTPNDNRQTDVIEDQKPQYVVTVHPNNGNNSFEWTINSEIPLIEREGYYFDGIYLDSMFKSATSFESLKKTGIVSDIDVYVKWTAHKHEFGSWYILIPPTHVSEGLRSVVWRRIGNYAFGSGKQNVFLMGKVGNGYKEFDPNYTQKSVDDEQNKVFSQTSWNGLSQNVATWANDIQLNDATTAIEGEALDRHVWVHKRDINLRDQCLEEKGKKCSICGFDSVAKYGAGFENIIEVHHKNPVSTGVRETTLNDLIPVCPNCHRALHSKTGGVYIPEYIKQIVDAHNE